MTLQYDLDRTTYDALFEEARRRIIPRNRDWTMHGPVDPGITILELYAALLEQRAFLANQISDPLGRAFLTLLGDEMRTAQIARTVLAFEPAAPGIVPALTYMRPERAAASRVFRTTEAVAVAPFLGLALETCDGRRDAVRDGVVLLPAHGRAARAVIVLRFGAPLPVDAWTGVLLHVDGNVAPQWSAEAVDVVPPAVLRFGSDAGAFTDVRDGTGGLRRSGLLRLRVPAGWERVGRDGYEYRLVIETDAATFTAPPRLRAIAPNAVIAHNRHWCSFEAQADALVPISGQTMQLPLDEGLPLEDRVRVRFADVTGTARTWRTTRELDRHGDDERVFVVDRERGLLRFGDGDQGQLPYPAAGTQVRARFEVGGGEIGNIGGRVRWTQWTRTGSASPWSALNPVPCTGGADPEQLDEACTRYASERTRPTRAVTKLDHEVIAIGTPGVAIARAHAAIDADPMCPTRFNPGVTTVYVVPEVIGTRIAEPRTDEGALAAVRRRLAGTRLVSHVVYVETAVYRPARITVVVEADPYDAAAVRASIADAVRAHLDPLHGGPDGDGWHFGAPLIPSDILRVAQGTLDETGDGGIVTQVLLALDDEALVGCQNRDIRDHELVALREVRVVIQRPGSDT
jgi:hypothetical protein